jgi:periplasmic protein TonB
MFDLIAGTVDRPFREQARGSTTASITLHVVVLTLVIGIPLLTITDTLPSVPAMMAFVAEPPAPPPPPPAPPPAARAAQKPLPKPVEKPASDFAAPIEAPAALPEPSDFASRGGEGGFEGGVPGGVEGGVPGGVIGGIVGGLVSVEPPPPPPPPTPPKPVRIGGQITAPALLKRVDPKYPDIANAAQLHGVVILEAVVDEAGAVQSVKVLRSPSVFLDHAAVEALKDWRYSPLVLNGIATPFILTVTFNFSIK